MSGHWREIIATWTGQDAFVTQNAKGVSLQMGNLDDRPGLSPMEMLLMAAAGCTGMDITSILRKQQQNLQAFQIRVKGNRADTYPMVYTDIQIEYLLWGENLDQKAVERAIHLSEDKYCSVGIMLRATAKFTTSYRLLRPGEKVD